LNRSTLSAFLTLLTLLVAFSAATGAASLVWKPGAEPRDVKGNGGRGDVDEGDLTPVAEEDEPEGGEYTNGTLRGQVTDAKTGLPVQGATVEVYQSGSRPRPRGRNATVVNGQNSRPSVLTDVNGKYSVEIAASPGKTLVGFSNQRYKTRHEWVGFRGESSLDVAIARDAFLIGTVQDEAGNKIPKFRVKAVKPGFLGIHDTTANISCDQQPFELNLGQGTWSVTVRAGKLASETVKVSIGSDDVKLDFVVRAVGEPASPTSR
jgi:hypothetical protein